MRIRGNNFWKCSWRAQLPLIAFFLVSCGGGGGGGSSPQGDPNRVGEGWINIAAPVAGGTYTTSADRVTLSGSTFISPTRYVCCTGLASDTGVSVIWNNATTARSGQAQQIPKYCWLFGDYLCGNRWGASIELVPGANVIAITASDGTNIGRASITVTSTYNVTPPVVTSSNPPNGTSVVPVNVIVMSGFDKPIDPGTLTSSTFLLTPGGGGPVSGAVNYSNNAATFVPSAVLAPFTRYTATLTTGIADIFGNHLAAAYSWSFVTGSATLTAPHFAYVANRGDNSISIYATDSVTGALTSIGSTPAGTAPVALALAGSTDFLYAADNLSSDISAYRVNKDTGALAPIGVTPGSVNWSQPGSMAVDPLGRFLYITSPGSNALATYSINPASGMPAIVNSTPFLSPGAVTVDPSGRFAYVTGIASGGAGSVISYAVDATTGTLAYTGISASGAGPCAIAVDPGDKFVYVTNCLSNDISVYSIDQTSGVLAGAGAPVSTGTEPSAIAVDPLGKFVYVANSQSNDVSIYTIDRSTGALMSAGASVAAGTMPSAIAIDPSDRFLYVTNQFSGSVSVYTIDAATGLPSGTLMPVPTGSFPASIIVQ